MSESLEHNPPFSKIFRFQIVRCEKFHDFIARNNIGKKKQRNQTQEKILGYCCAIWTGSPGKRKKKNAKIEGALIRRFQQGDQLLILFFTEFGKHFFVYAGELLAALLEEVNDGCASQGVKNRSRRHRNDRFLSRLKNCQYQQ